MPFSDMTGALQRGIVSAAFLVEPFVTQNGAHLQHLMDPYSEIAGTFPISLVVASRAWLSSNAQTAQRFVNAIYETARWANQNRDATTESEQSRGGTARVSSVPRVVAG